MTGRHTGVWEQIRALAPNAIFMHCMIHRESLASKKMSVELKATFDQAVKTVNFIKARPLNSRLFAQLCAEMGSEHDKLLLHTEVRWLSRGQVFNRLFELRDPVHLFLAEKTHECASFFEDNFWLAQLAYFADIFQHLNNLNRAMQGPQSNLILLSDKVSGFMAKLTVWRKRVSSGIIEMFPAMHNFLQLEENTGINRDHLFSLVDEHITSLSEQFQFYFGDLDVKNKSWICDPFSVNVEDLDLPLLEVDKLIELSHDTSRRAKHRSITLVQF